MTHDPNINALWARLMVEELVRCGLRDVCISPGSRSTPLTLAFAQMVQRRDDVHMHIHVDERVAAFYALGLAKQTERPVALVCTSGSAGVHYHPAFVEATHANLPLIALTADRPQALMHCGAGQTIEQKQFFGPHVRQTLHLDLPSLRPLALRHVRLIMDQLYAVSMGWQGGAPGPVHVNVPFEEPLAPIETGDIDPSLYTQEPLAMYGRDDDQPLTQYAHQPPVLGESVIDGLNARLRQAERPVVVCGPLDVLGWSASDAIIALAERLQAPILADPLSGMRWVERTSEVVLAYGDAILRSTSWAASHQPDLVIRFGAMPTSKVYRFWREAHPEAEEWLIDPYGRVLDQVQQAHRVLHVDPQWLATRLCVDLLPSSGATGWLSRWLEANAMAKAAVTQACSSAPTLWEGDIARRVVSHLPDGATLMAASSMPIRDVDAFGGHGTKRISCIANRGANGIDGLLATSFGVAMHAAGPVVTLIGDVATLHDVGGLLSSHVLLANRPDANVTIVLINNGGGGIFSFLPIAKFDAYFEPLFITPQNVEFKALAQAYGLDYTVVRDVPGFEQALGDALARPGVKMVEVIVDREDNVRRHKDLWHHISQALEQTLE